MLRLIPVNTNRNSTLLRRTIEAELEMQKNSILGLMLGVLLLALLFACQGLLPSEREIIRYPKDDTRIFVPQLPPDFDTPKPPVSAGPRVPEGRKGTPVPVAELDPSITLTPQDSLQGIPGDLNGGGNDWGGGDGRVSSERGPMEILEEVEPDSFIVVERYPVVVHPVSPVYPEILMKAGIQGKVIVSIWVNKQGKPHKVRLIQADNELFNEAAMEAAKQFLFTPAYMNNGPVSVWVTVPFAFRLK
jgi:TonB family protein